MTDEDADPQDYRIELPPGELISLQVDQLTSVETVFGGEVVLSGDLACLGSPTTPCQITLKRLRIELDPIDVDTNVGDFTLESSVLTYEAPLSIESEGDGFLIPVGATVHTCTNVQGVSEHAAAQTTETSVLAADVFNRVLSFAGSLPFVVKVGPHCDVIPMLISGFISGETPWAQAPPP